MRIGIFDSGIGGLTVLKKMIDKYPNNEYIYIGDTLNVPYGNKSKNQLMDLSINIINYLIERKVDKIIIACGTVSSNIGEQLKENYNLPIIDIISPTIDYIIKNKYKKVGVIATSMTIRSNIFYNRLSKNNIEVINVECPKLVPVIEANDTDKINLYLAEYLERFKKNKVDTIVLGCTHYPIVRSNIETYLNNEIKLLNMADPVASLFSNIDNKPFSLEIYFSKLNQNTIKNTKLILGCKVNYSIKEIKL